MSDSHPKVEHGDRERTVLESSLSELKCLKKCHPSLTYYFFVNLYAKNCYQDILKLSTEYVASPGVALDQDAIALLHNIRACCYTKLRKPLMAIMHWRKAVSCVTNEFFLVPLLYNLHKTYSKCGMTEPADEILKQLLFIVNSKREDYGAECWFVFQIDKAHIFEVDVTKRHAISNVSTLTHFAANYSLRIGEHSSAIERYNSFFAQIGSDFDPGISTNASEYHLPLALPPVMQITSEYALALYADERIDNLLSLDTTEMSYAASAFKRCQGALFSKLTDETPLTDAEKSAFVTTGEQIFHCVSTSIFKLAAEMKTDCSTAKREIECCLEALDTVQPPITSNVADEPDQDIISVIESRLAACKAMLYFNLSLVLSRLPHETVSLNTST